MAKRKKLSPIQKALLGVSKDVSAGSKKTAKKVATPKVTPPKTQALQDRGAAVRTLGPLARQPTFTERASAKSEQMARKRARLKRKRLSAKKHEVDPVAKGVRRGIRSVEDALRLLDEPEELPDYYRKTMRPKTLRALERHVARQPAIERAEREALRKTKVKSTFEDIVEELPAVKLVKGLSKTKRLVLDPAAKWAEKEIKRKGVKLPVGSGPVGLPMAAATGKTTSQAKIDAGILVRGAKDIAGLPVDVPAGLYKVGEAGYKAVPIPGLKKSDTSGVEEIAKSAWEHDPYILLARGKGKEAAREFNKHPGLAALEVYGIGAAASRTAAVGARAATGGRVGSRKRASKILPHTKVKLRQEYSRGLAGQTVQKRKERKASEEARELYKESMRARRSGDRATAGRKYREASEKNPFRLTETNDPRGPLQRRVDQREHVAEQRRRLHREIGLKKVEKLLPKKHRDIALLIGANIVQPTKESLRAYVTHLEKKEKGLGPAKVAANRQLRKQIEEALDDPKLNLEVLGEAAREYGKLTGGLGKDLVERGILDAKAEEMAKLVPVAVSPKESGGMGATPDDKTGPRVASQEFDVEASLRSIERNRRKGKPRPDRKELLAVAKAAEANAAAQRASGKFKFGKANEVHQDWLAAALRAQAAGQPKVPTRLRKRVEAEQTRELRPGEIKAHLRRTGRDPDETAFFSQMPFTNASSAFYQGHFSQPKGVSSKRKSGKATDEGGFGLTDETARESVARGTGLKSLFDEYVEELKEFGRRSGKDLERHSTKMGANQRVADLAAKGQDWVAVPLKPLFGKAKHASELYRRANEPDILDLEDGVLSPREGLTTAMKGGEGQPGTQYALVPKFVADRFVKHIEATKTSSGGRLWRETNRLFRGAVLATSPSWVLGNITEASFRAAVKGAGPGSYKLGKNVIRRLEEIDPVAAEELLIRLGQGHLGMQELQAIHVVVSSFDNSGKAIRSAVGAGAKVRRAKGINRVANGWKTYTHHVFSKNGILEKQFKVALLGRRLKQELKGADGLLPNASELRTMDRAADDLARGLRGTDAQVQMTEWVTRAYGRYEAFGPAGRKFISQYTPFAAWYINAVNFVFHVMPQDHPVLTGFVAANHRATEEWRNEVGLDIAPSWLKGALPVPGGFRPLSRYTPFGAFQDPLETPVKLFLPSVSGLMMNAQGLDWKGKPLNDKDSTEDVTNGERAAEMGKTLLSSFMPIFGQIKRGAAKEGSILSRAGEVLNPVRKQDFDVAQGRAFIRLAEIEKKLEDMPTLERAGEGSKAWLERTKLNAERGALWGKIHKLSKGEYGRAPSAGSAGPPSFGGGGGPAGPKFGGVGAVAGPKFGG